MGKNGKKKKLTKKELKILKVNFFISLLIVIIEKIIDAIIKIITE